MQVLRKGSTGVYVEKWQAFLKGLSPDSNILISGIFEDFTDKETKAFQKRKKLTPDGIVGRKTLAIALQNGFSLLEDPTCNIDGPNWPAKPVTGPLSASEREKLFGVFSYVSSPVPSNPEAITIRGNWASNISQITIPQLSGVVGAPQSCNVQFHSLLIPQVIKLFDDWDAAGLKYLLLSFCGSWVPRYIRGSRSILSNHAWGTAFDINVQWNMLGAQPALRGETGSVRELVDIAYENGFYWGGWFPRRADGMHFEAYKIL